MQYRARERTVSHHQQFSTEFPLSPREGNPSVTPDIQRQAALFKNRLFLAPFLNAVPQLFIIVNQEGRIVHTNHPLAEIVWLHVAETFCDLRPGDVLKCIHALEEGGCGSTESCQLCGAADAIRTSRTQGETVRECRIIQHETGDTLDLRIWATPYWVNDEQFTLLVFTDISHEKRRKALERIFFHDILNTAGALLGFCQLLQEAEGDQIDRFRERISRLTERIIHEIKSQRDLVAAENNEITPQPAPLRSIDLLREIRDLFISQEEWRQRDIRLDPAAADVVFTSDHTLLSRVLCNMMKNALEASTPNQVVTAGCTLDEDRVTFWIHNPNFMPRPVQLQVFQRSFSTKDPDRGLGTYSMKLLTERYLRGKVWFETRPETGTRFFAAYPLNLDSPKSE